jgi:hypothetical protein
VAFQGWVWITSYKDHKNFDRQLLIVSRFPYTVAWFPRKMDLGL